MKTIIGYVFGILGMLVLASVSGGITHLEPTASIDDWIQLLGAFVLSLVFLFAGASIVLNERDENY